MKNLYIFLCIIALVACKNDAKDNLNQEKNEFTKEKSTQAQEVLDKVMAHAGGDKYETSVIEFRFRGKKYVSIRNCGMYELQRVEVTQAQDTIKDVLFNTGFERTVNRKKQNLPDSLNLKYKNAVNSVHYFVQLPFGLNDPAVQKAYIDTTQINDITYHKIQVKFSENGGGDDHEDLYVYWIHQEKNTIDYLAYSFEVNGGGMRFRKAINPRIINGIRFVDYENYAPKDNNIEVKNLDKAFMNNQLKKVSVITNEDIKVILGKDKCN